MKKKQLLKQIIRDFHLSENFDVKLRNIQPPIDTKNNYLDWCKKMW